MHVVEDAVPALGVSLHGRKLGTFGVVGAFSTQSDKSLNTGEGGFLLTHDPSVFARAVVLSGAFENRAARHGIPDDVHIDELSHPIFSFRMDEIRGALARAQLAKLPHRLEIQKRNYDQVADSLQDCHGISLRQPIEPTAMLGESLIFRVEDAKGPWFAQALRAEGIDARCLGDATDTNIRCFWNWRFLYPDSSVEQIKSLAPRTASLLESAVDVPISPLLTGADCEDVVRAVRKVAYAMVSPNAPVRRDIVSPRDSRVEPSAT
jgi:dTDP-4-amino-4,6-dideoxygalactose transaminase